MTQTRYTCTLTRAGEPACQSYAHVTIVDIEGTSGRACPRHAVAALNGIVGAHVYWPDSKGLNEWERKALELAEERSHHPDQSPAARSAAVSANLGRADKPAVWATSYVIATDSGPSCAAGLGRSLLR